MPQVILGHEFKVPGVVSNWFQQPAAKEFLDFLLSQIDEQNRLLGKEANAVELYRAQGAKMALEKVIELPGRLREFLDRQNIIRKEGHK